MTMRADVDHVDRTEGRLRVEGLLFGFQAGRAELRFDELARGVESGRAGRTRSDVHEPPEILEGSRTVEFRRRRSGLRADRRGQGCYRQDCDNHPPSHPHLRFSFAT
jgi:hypothetical protein